METNDMIERLMSFTEAETRELIRRLDKKGMIFQTPRWLIEEYAKKEVFEDLEDSDLYKEIVSYCSWYKELKDKHLKKKV